jgi:hypothetical protein
MLLEPPPLRVIGDDLGRDAEHQLIQKTMLDEHAKQRRAALADDHARRVTLVELRPQLR